MQPATTRRDSDPQAARPLGLRWPIERTNSWLSNFGQVCRNTDRHTAHCLALLALAIVLLLTEKLFDWAHHWSQM